jgi:hypothetical protein
MASHGRDSWLDPADDAPPSGAENENHPSPVG